MNQPSTPEFPSVTKKQWIQQAIKDLKGKSFDETLVWKSPEGIFIQPYYASEDLEKLPLYVIQTSQLSKTVIGFQNCPTIIFTQEKETNLLIINTLKKGAEAVRLDFDEVVIQYVNLVKLLDNIKLSDTPIIFCVNEQSVELIESLQKFINYQMKGGIQDDILARWMITGKIDESWKNTIKAVKLSLNSPKFHAIVVGSHHFHKAGANAVQELAFTLASAVTYADKLTDNGLTIDEIIPKIAFSISIGTNYFLEIAKLRVLRYLWAVITEEFGFQAINKAQPFECTIHCENSTFYDAALSPYTNMLRATTEAMAAVIGGCDWLTIHGYDAVFQPDTTSDEREFAERIAQNIGIILKEEAYLDKVNDPSAGSYYLENLTNELAKSTWELFLKIEEMGGMMAAFQAGFVQEEIEKSYQAKVEALKNGQIMVGVNKFKVDGEVLQDVDNQEVVDEKRWKLLKNRRISETFEK